MPLLVDLGPPHLPATRSSQKRTRKCGQVSFKCYFRPLRTPLVKYVFAKPWPGAHRGKCLGVINEDLWGKGNSELTSGSLGVTTTAQATFFGDADLGVPLENVSVSLQLLGLPLTPCRHGRTTQFPQWYCDLECVLFPPCRSGLIICS